MRNRHKSLLLASLLAAGPAFPEVTHESLFHPARVGRAADSLISHLQCPSRTGNENNIVVFCQAGLTETGNASWSLCFTPEHEQFPYRNEIKRAIAKATFVPASVNGETVEVSFSFRVSFSWDGDVCTFAVIPNWGFNDAGMGINYIAPQEILHGGQGWPRKAPRSGDKQVVALIRSGIMFSMSVLVSPDGTASASRLEHNAFASRKEIQNALRAIEGSRFIPGFYGGKPAPMRFHEILFVP